MSRAFILLFDSFGLGATPDAGRDAGADTFGHIAAWRAAHGRPLHLPNLERLGLAAAHHAATGTWAAGFARRDGFDGAYGAARERSSGKDTPSGHWEIAGVPVEFEWGYFAAPGNAGADIAHNDNDENRSDGVEGARHDPAPTFPPELIAALLEACNLPGALGLCHASGTEIINRHGDEHCASGKPIIYTSADSVLQIAAHEQHFGLQRLLAVCETAFKLVAPYNIGRVIARPFLGSDGQYQRSHNRKDYAVPPPAPTLLDVLVEQGGQVHAIGKIGDIFAHRGISRVIKANGNDALFDALLRTTAEAKTSSLTFVNFVDFDQNFGHRRNVAGYADALEALDARLPEFTALLQPGDLAVITADHGCDPTWPGSDHTREHVPMLFFGPQVAPQALGIADTFADIGQTLAAHLALPPLSHGRSLYDTTLDTRG